MSLIGNFGKTNNPSMSMLGSKSQGPSPDNKQDPTNIISILNPTRSSVNMAKLNQQFTTGDSHNANNTDESVSNDNDNDHDNDNSNDNDDSDNAETNQSANEHNIPGVPPRKRSKVSRACDECRRKKVRCDAVFDLTSNTVTVICTNCKKNGDTCMFTRIPLKRGPNKGYNKRSNDQQQSNESSSSPNTNVPSNNLKSRRIRRVSSKSRSNSTNIAPTDPVAALQTPITTLNPNLASFGGFQQVVLPPLDSITTGSSSSNNQPNGNSISKQANSSIFWKMPTEMPNLNYDSQISAGNMTRNRKASMDSISSMSSNSSINNLRRNNSNHSASKSITNKQMLENSDSEDEFLLSSSNRLSRSSFQVPFNLSNNSTRNSFATDRDHRSSASSSIISNGLGSAHSNISAPLLPQQFQQQLSPPLVLQQQLRQSLENEKSLEFKNELYQLLQFYYSHFHEQYPLLLKLQIIKESIDLIIDDEEFNHVIELFYMALQSLNLDIFNENDTVASQNQANKLYGDGLKSLVDLDINKNFSTIVKSFEYATSMFLSKASIYSSDAAKIVFTSALILLNYSVIITGFDYSLGFGISFSYFRDWLMFKEGYESPCFINLIQLVILDCVHSLYFGLPRSSTVCLAIDLPFINTFLKTIELSNHGNNTDGNLEFEWISVGLHLVLLSNSMQNLDSLDKLSTIEISGTEFKFMMIIKLYFDLFVYCKQLSVKMLNIQNELNNSNNSVDSINIYFEHFIHTSELELTKICKKITNLIDEQIDDIELSQINILLPLMIVKLVHILSNLEIFLKSIIHLNEILDTSNEITKSLFSNHNNSSSKLNGINRSRSSSRSSIISNSSSNSITINTGSASNKNLRDCSKRFTKILENNRVNIDRCLSINKINKHSSDIIRLITNNSSKVELNVPRTTNNGLNKIDYLVIITNWIRLVNNFFANEITKEGINGWSCV